MTISNVIRDGFRLDNLKKFITSVTTGPDKLYIGFGRPQPWSATDTVDSQWAAKNTTGNEMLDREDLMSIKKVSSDDISHGIIKEIYVTGRKYDIYRHDWDGSIPSVYSLDGSTSYPTSLSKAKYVVVTGDGGIYICVKQGKDGNVVRTSTISPQDTTSRTRIAGTNVYVTSDGYMWMYVGSPTGTQIQKFSSITHYPVRTGGDSAQIALQDTASLYKSGIYNIEIVSGGINYNNGVSGTFIVNDVTNADANSQFRIIGNGTGLELTVTYAAGGVISDISVSKPGSGYTYASVIVAPGPKNGSGATISVIITPPWGLGADPVRDCSGTYLLVGVSVDSDSGGKFTTSNDYRKVVMLSNPSPINSTSLLDVPQASAMYSLSLSGIVGSGASLLTDAIVTSSTGWKGRVVDLLGSTLRIIVTSTENYGNTKANIKPQPNDVLSFTDVNTSGTINYTATISSVTLPEVNVYSGNIIYSSWNSTASTRSANTSDLPKIIIEF